MEWWASTTDSKWVMQPSFEDAFFNENNSTMAVATRTLNDIATFGKLGAIAFTTKLFYVVWF
jgi:hypothetical protein